MKHILFSICILFSVVANAQFNQSKMDSLFYQLDKNNKAMVSVAIHQKEKSVYKKSIGFANIENNVKADENTLYGIGSVSKMFTAVMMYQLFDEKKIHPNTTIQVFFPFIKNAKNITVGQLLNHSSGIHNFTNDTLFFTYNDQPKTDKELIEMFNKMPADFEPGTKHEYSNTNYVLLSIIIEKIGKAPYGKQLQERICNKLSLKNTFYGFEKIQQRFPTASYSLEDGKWIKEKSTHSSIPKGAGAIVSSANDLCVFIEGLFAGKLMSEKSFKEMTTINDGFGNGIFEIPFYTKKGSGHNGSIDGFHSMLTYFSAEKTALCILGNGYDYEMNDIGIGMLSILFDKKYVVPTFQKSVIDANKTGVYSNSKIGMNITISENENQLFAQATGQSAFPLDKINDTDYKFDAAKIEIHFNKDKNGNIPSFLLKQGGKEMVFEK